MAAVVTLVYGESRTLIEKRERNLERVYINIEEAIL